jgi:hypothetical protein
MKQRYPLLSAMNYRHSQFEKGFRGYLSFPTDRGTRTAWTPFRKLLRYQESGQVGASVA